MFIKLSIDCQLFDVLRYLLDRRPGGKWPGFLCCFLFHKDSRSDHMTSLLLRVFAGEIGEQENLPISGCGKWRFRLGCPMRKWKPTLQGHRWVRFRTLRYISRFHQPWICRIPDSVMKHPGFHASCNSNLPKLVRKWALKHWQVGEFLGPAARFCRVLLLGEPGCWGLSQLVMFFFGYDVFHGVLFKRHSVTWIRNSWISFFVI